MSNTYYANEKSGVQVTDAMLMTGGSSYPLRNINSVKMMYRDLPWLKNTALAALGGFLIWIVLNAIGSAMLGKFGAIAGSLLGVGVVGACIYNGIKAPRVAFYAAVSTSNGEVSAFESNDQSEVQKLVDAVNSAISNL